MLNQDSSLDMDSFYHYETLIENIPSHPERLPHPDPLSLCRHLVNQISRISFEVEFTSELNIDNPSFEFDKEDSYTKWSPGLTETYDKRHPRFPYDATHRCGNISILSPPMIDNLFADQKNEDVKLIPPLTCRKFRTHLTASFLGLFLLDKFDDSTAIAFHVLIYLDLLDMCSLDRAVYNLHAVRKQFQVAYYKSSVSEILWWNLPDPIFAVTEYKDLHMYGPFQDFIPLGFPDKTE